MFRINKLEEQYQDLVAADQREWLNLSECVQRLGSGFANYLAADDNSNSLSNANPKVIVGMLGENGLVDPDPAKLSRDGRALQFALRLDLADEITEIPPSYFVFQLELRPSESGVKLFDRTSMEEISLNKGLISAFEYFYQEISSRLQKL